jgi:hypothetical protein
LWKEYLQSESILKWENHEFCKKIPSSEEVKKHRYLMEQYNLCYRQESLAHCFQMRIGLLFKGIPPTSQGFCVRNITFAQNSSIEVKGRGPVSPGR